MLLSKSAKMSQSIPVSKRVFDLLLASSLLVISAPFMLIAALVIRIESPGSCVIGQRRVGHQGQPFVMYKFRSMVLGVDDELHHRAVRNWMIGVKDSNASSYKIQNDPRITKVGHVLRKYSLDELPQLFNVLLGDMSLVGPRPPLPYEYDSYTDLEAQRLRVLPGITGLWQVNGWHHASFEEMVQDDLRYTREWSIWLDIAILLKTVPIVLLGRGS